MAQSLFSKYLGKLEVDVDGEILELDVQLKDKQKILSLVSKFGAELTEENVAKLAEAYKDIIVRSYPSEDVEAIDAFIAKKFESIMTGLAVAFGWTTKEELEKRVGERQKKGIPPFGAGAG